jgi:hypothetical protein
VLRSSVVPISRASSLVRRVSRPTLRSTRTRRRAATAGGVGVRRRRSPVGCFAWSAPHPWRASSPRAARWCRRSAPSVSRAAGAARCPAALGSPQSPGDRWWCLASHGRRDHGHVRARRVVRGPPVAPIGAVSPWPLAPSAAPACGGRAQPNPRCCCHCDHRLVFILIQCGRNAAERIFVRWLCVMFLGYLYTNA